MGIALLLTVLAALYRFYPSYSLRFLFGTLSMSAFLCFGFVHSAGQKEESAREFVGHLYKEGDQLWLKSKDEISHKNGRQVLVASAIAFERDGEWSACSGNILCYMPPGLPDLFEGSYFSVISKPWHIPPPLNPGQFDYQSYLYYQHINLQCYLDSSALLVSHRATPSALGVYALRNSLIGRIQNSPLSKESKQLLQTMLLGQKQLLDRDIYKEFSKAGLVHVLAVSGLHVGLMYWLLSFITRRIPGSGRVKYARLIILILGLWFYAALTGFSAAVLRATTMFCFMVIADFSGRLKNVYNSLFASAFCLLMFDPYLLFQVGFQLSYAAVFGILYGYPRLRKHLKSKWWLTDKIGGLMAVSLSAQWATLPLILYYFKSFPTYFLLSNLFLLPALILSIYLGLLYLILLHTPLLSAFLSWTINTLINSLLKAIGYINSLPKSTLELPDFDLRNAVFLILASGLILYFLKRAMASRLMSLLALVVLWLATEIFYDFSEDKSMLAIHPCAKDFAISLESKERLTLLLPDKMTDNPRSLYSLSGWLKGKQVDTIFLSNIDNPVNSTCSNAALIKASNISVLVCDRPCFRPWEQQKIDYLFVRHNALKALPDEHINMGFKYLVVDASSYFSNRNRLEEQCLTRGIKFADLSRDGYLRISLKPRHD